MDRQGNQPRLAFIAGKLQGCSIPALIPTRFSRRTPTRPVYSIHHARPRCQECWSRSGSHRIPVRLHGTEAYWPDQAVRSQENYLGSVRQGELRSRRNRRNQGWPGPGQAGRWLRGKLSPSAAKPKPTCRCHCRIGVQMKLHPVWISCIGFRSLDDDGITSLWAENVEINTLFLFLWKILGEVLQEGPSAAGEPPEIRETRRYVQLDIPERRFRPVQLEGSLLAQAYLRKFSASDAPCHFITPSTVSSSANRLPWNKPLSNKTQPNPVWFWFGFSTLQSSRVKYFWFFRMRTLVYIHLNRSSTEVRAVDLTPHTDQLTDLNQSFQQIDDWFDGKPYPPTTTLWTFHTTNVSAVENCQWISRVIF